MKKISNNDVIIVGTGMVGLSLAYQLKEKYNNLNITFIEKERKIGLHSSGRNSGVIHAGIYYPPNSLKAKVCVNGARRLKDWIEDNNISILKCGKIIIPQKSELDSQLDVLYERGIKNGAEVSLINEKELLSMAPMAKSSSGRGLWSPNTSVVNPSEVLDKLYKIVKSKKVNFIFNSYIKEVDENSNMLKVVNKNSSAKNIKISYGYLFNCAGSQADKVASLFKVGLNYKILPFKGIYWDLKKDAPFKIKTNLYPVPDLKMPFLGVHATPDISGRICFGPTAIPAFGKENYKNLEKFEPMMSIAFLGVLLKQIINNENNFREYALNQALLGLKPLFIKSLQEIIPEIKMEHLKLSSKVGIRSQLYDKKNDCLVNDFLLKKSEKSLHVLNAISPAFTASFSLADLIISETNTF